MDRSSCRLKRGRRGVPRRPVLDRQVSKMIGGTVGEGGISWTLGRQRGPEIL
ncbi:DUF3363 domain-containing protein [Sphingopyxis sp.]|uniref:DUF3363 domain-containing protein n=1 Tax=Sphingopyxis sp. TaxID=1908224 RepID=UPI001DF224E4|nr:DUF3363 domain-containing protein [Sphingopyxis sp.]MBW8296749.1 DUF3363 domain-containing protein [Sphingopyxis sp.]